MTFNAEEVAFRIADDFDPRAYLLGSPKNRLINSIAVELEKAHAAGVAEENEACAKIVSDWYICGPDGPRSRSGSLIVDVIRQRLKEKLR